MKELKFANFLMLISLFLCFSIKANCQRGGGSGADRGGPGTGGGKWVWILAGTNPHGACKMYAKPNSSCIWFKDECAWKCWVKVPTGTPTSSHFNVSNTSLGDSKVENIYKIGPNPFTSELHIQVKPDLKIQSQKEVQITVFSLSGEKVYHSKVSGSIQINTSRFNNGMYILQIADDKDIYRRNILKID